MGDLDRAVVWKLKGPLLSSLEPVLGLPALSSDIEL
jgi:hypothetical protein